MVRKHLSGTVWLLGATMLTTSSTLAQAADWPQWRGPKRDNISTDLGLRRNWPKEGLPLLWRAEGLGNSATSISLADGRIFALGFLPEGEHLLALDQATGKHLWKTNLAPSLKYQGVMQWLNQRSPTIDGDRIYALSTPGVLHCLEAGTGKEIWRKDYRKEFDGRPGPWGFCDFPLVDGDRVICTPGGKEATMVALDKRTGAVLWKSVVPGDSRTAHGAAVLADVAGTRMVIHQLDSGAVGIAPKDGKLLWHHPKIATRSGNVHTAIVRGNEVFFSCGWGTGWGLLKIERAGDKFEAKEIYYQKGNLDPWLGSSVLIDDEVHTACGKRIDWKTGALKEDLRWTRSTMVAAESRLYHRTSANEIRLTEITEKGYVATATFRPPRPGINQPPWSYPIIAGGKLWLRDQDWLLCYDLAGPK